MGFLIMRRDARKLLDKLSRKDFRYREFTDAFSETELWPIFENLLRDERIVGEDQAALAHRARPAQPTVSLSEPAAPLPAPAPPPAASEARPSQFFERYQTPPPSQGDRMNVDLRDFFGRFAELD